MPSKYIIHYFGNFKLNISQSLQINVLLIHFAVFARFKTLTLKLSQKNGTKHEISYFKSDGVKYALD